MREFRPTATLEATSGPRATVANVPDGDQSAMDALAKAAEISRSGVAPRSRRASAVREVERIDLSSLTSAPPLHQPSVPGAASSNPGDHVGGAMLPPPVNTVALSDGTRISFGAVGEVPVHEYA